MIRFLGNILRSLGLLIEMLGVWGVYTGGKSWPIAPVALPGGETVTAPWLAVGLGFLLWIVGMVMVLAGGRPARRPPRDRDADEFQVRL